MNDKPGSNPPGLPAWPLVFTTQPGVIVVTGKLRDPDVFEMCARKIGFAIASLGLSLTIFYIDWLTGHIFSSFWLGISKSLFSIFDSFRPIGVRLIESAIVLFVNLVICAVGFVGFAIIWDFATRTIGRPLSSFVYFWIRTSVLLKFTDTGVEILRPRTNRRKFTLTGDVTNLEFHAAAHPWQERAARNRNSGGNAGLREIAARATARNSSDFGGTSSIFLDAFAVNLVYGVEVVRLLSADDEKPANDFVACCRWAADQTWNREISPGIPQSKSDLINDDD